MATAVIADFPLRFICDCRRQGAMSTVANNVIDALGGSTAVSRLTETPLSTVHSWRKNGIPASRFAHLRLAAAAREIPVDLDAIAARASAPAVCGRCDLRSEHPQVASCTRSDCPLSAKEAA